MIEGRKEKFFTCSGCGSAFSNSDALRSCSNCFSCTGCEIYTCPSCGAEVVVKPPKPFKKAGLP